MGTTGGPSGLWCNLNEQANQEQGTSYQAFVFYDSPNTILSVQYQVYWNHIFKNGGTMYMNRASAINVYDGLGQITGSSSLTLTELSSVRVLLAPA